MGQESTNAPGYAAVIGHIARDLGHVVQDELELVRAESRDMIPRVARQLLVLAFSVLVLSVSVLPLLAFAVIGLGRLLGDNYWLSALIVGVVGLAAGGMAALAALRRLKGTDFALPRSRRALRESASTLLGKIKEPPPGGGERSAV